MEKRLLAENHGGSRIIIENGTVRVEFTFATCRDNYEMVAYFPKNYPYDPMQVFVKSPTLESPPHRYTNGRLCLHGDNDFDAGTTAKVYIDWAKQWILTYEKWLATGEWPVGNKGN